MILTITLLALVFSNIALWVAVCLTIAWAHDVDKNLSKLLDWINEADRTH